MKRKGKGEGFTLAVVIDDLDRCPTDKIMLVLQAMHLLLEQPGAPMAVFLAVDPRIVVSAIEKSLAGVSDEVHTKQLAVHRVRPASICKFFGFACTNRLCSLFKTNSLSMPMTRRFITCISKSAILCAGIPGSCCRAGLLLLSLSCMSSSLFDPSTKRAICGENVVPFVRPSPTNPSSRVVEPSQVNGLQYLDKIVHIPFCIPRIDEEACRDYVGDLLNLRDSTGQETRETEETAEINLEEAQISIDQEVLCVLDGRFVSTKHCSPVVEAPLARSHS